MSEESKEYVIMFYTSESDDLTFYKTPDVKTDNLRLAMVFSSEDQALNAMKIFHRNSTYASVVDKKLLEKRCVVRVNKTDFFRTLLVN